MNWLNKMPPVTLIVRGGWVEMRFIARDMILRNSHERETAEQCGPKAYQEYAAAVRIKDWTDDDDLVRKQESAVSTLLRSARLTFRLLETDVYESDPRDQVTSPFACQTESGAHPVLLPLESSK